MPSNAGGAGSIPGQEAKILHASQPKTQSIKLKQYCNKFKKDCKNDSIKTLKRHQKNLKNKKTKKHNLTKSMGCNKSISKGEVHSDTGLPQETRKVSNKQPNLKELEKEEQTKPKVSRRKEIIKIREEINKMEI